MLSIRNLNIRKKLLTIIMVTSTMAVLLAGVVFIVFSVVTHKKDLAQERMSLAEVIGNNCKVILEFNFPEDARKVLSSLDAKESIVLARLYDKDGNVFSTYGRYTLEDAIPFPDRNEKHYIFAKKHLHVFYPVRVNEDIIGMVYLVDDMRTIYSRMYRDITALVVIALNVLIIAYLLSMRLQGMISGPILSLADLTNAVSEHKDYALRAQKENDDEVGQLIDSFNSMLAQIQKQHNEIRESEERFMLALKGGDLGTWDWNIVTGESVFSKRWIEMLGYTVDEIVPHYNTWKNLMHPEDAPRVMALLKEHLEGKVSFYETEFRLRTRTGGWKWILARGRIFAYDEYGNPLRSVGTHLDITERKEAEKERIERDEKMHAILAAVPDLMIILNTEGRYMDILTRQSDSLAVPNEDAVGRTIHDFFPLEIAQEFQAVINETIRTREIRSYEYMLKEGDTDKWFAALMVPFRFQNSDCVLCSVRNITKLKNAELERQRMAAQLMQSQKMESIGTLAGGIAHDFNNILSIMLGNIELSLDTPLLNESIRKYLQEVMTAGLRAKDLVQQLLNFSRKSEQKQKPLNISRTIKESLKMLRASISKNIEIIELEMDESCVVFSDPIHIHQIMVNIGTNAAHAMSVDGGILSVAVSTVDIGKDNISSVAEIRDGVYAKITVSDTGDGIPKEYIDRIFDPYFTTKEVGKGSGIGLSVVHGIVKSNNGAIWVESVEGEGTTFTILFPLVDEAPEIEEIKNEIAPQGKERILFVDDEEMIVEIVEHMLSNLGYHVIGKKSSTEALELFQSSPDAFDLVISDMSMPEMSGDRFAEKIMQIRPGTPFILCTGFMDKMADDKSRALGIRAVVMKPIVKAEFARTIRNVMDNVAGNG